MQHDVGGLPLEAAGGLMTMMREFGSEKRMSFSRRRAATIPSTPACPVQSVETAGRMNCMVS